MIMFLVQVLLTSSWNCQKLAYEQRQTLRTVFPSFRHGTKITPSYPAKLGRTPGRASTLYAPLASLVMSTTFTTDLLANNFHHDLSLRLASNLLYCLLVRSEKLFGFLCTAQLSS
jgi:hypothetical protein